METIGFVEVYRGREECVKGREKGVRVLRAVYVSFMVVRLFLNMEAAARYKALYGEIYKL